MAHTSEAALALAVPRLGQLWTDFGTNWTNRPPKTATLVTEMLMQGLAKSVYICKLILNRFATDIDPNCDRLGNQLNQMVTEKAITFEAKRAHNG